METEQIIPVYRVSRNAPAELVGQYPELWEKLSRQRFAWLQLPWLLVFLVLVVPNWPVAIVIIALWVWQRKKPGLLACKIIELLIYLYFTLLLMMSFALFNVLPGGPFVPVALFGGLVLLYEASARSWHYLFNYMAMTNAGFLELALSNNWIAEQQETMLYKKYSVVAAITGSVLGLLAIVGMSVMSGS